MTIGEWCGAYVDYSLCGCRISGGWGKATLDSPGPILTDSGTVPNRAQCLAGYCAFCDRRIAPLKALLTVFCVLFGGGVLFRTAATKPPPNWRHAGALRQTRVLRNTLWRCYPTKLYCTVKELPRCRLSPRNTDWLENCLCQRTGMFMVSCAAVQASVILSLSRGSSCCFLQPLFYVVVWKYSLLNGAQCRWYVFRPCISGLRSWSIGGVAPLNPTIALPVEESAFWYVIRDVLFVASPSIRQRWCALSSVGLERSLRGLDCCCS